jgi:LAO/AO transport system kinase
MWTLLEDFFRARLRANPAAKALLPELERQVAEGALSPTVAVDKIAAAVGL